MRIGLRAHDIQSNDPLDLCKKLNNLNVRNIQLALSKSIKNFDLLSNRERIIELKELKKILIDFDITVNVLGCYINPIDPNASNRNKGIDKFVRHFEYASILEAELIGTETGSINSDGSFNPYNHGEEAYKQLCDVVYNFVKLGEQHSINIGIEAVSQFVIHDIGSIKKLLNDCNSNRLKIVFDIVNMLNISNFKDADKITKEIFEVIPDKIAVLHLKDYKLTNNNLEYGPPTSGIFDYNSFMQIVKENKPELDVIVEETRQENAEIILDYIRGKL